MMRRLLLALVACTFCLVAGPVLAQAVDPAPAEPPAPPLVESTPEIGSTPDPIGALRTDNHADYWRQVREGERGYQPNPSIGQGVMIQSAGEGWRNLRNGPYLRWSGYLLLGMIGLLALFFAIRGRIRVEHGFAGYEIRRFRFLERMTHWLTATSFVLLALTGLVLIFGRPLLIPLIGKEAFAALAYAGKTVHNYIAFAFMLGIVLMLVIWVRHNIPNRQDLAWLARGGFLSRSHPAAAKFNAGQKILFWLVILFGISVSLSGLQLLFPYEFAFFGKTFALFNWLPGVNLPTELSPIHEQQLATLWHGIIAVVYTAVIFGHIYIGSLGMEGAFSAMGSGRVDLNWAREHHSLWVEELQEQGTARH